MKRIHYLLLFVGLLALNSAVARAGQITHTVTYDPSKISFSDSTTTNGTFAIVEYEGLLSYNENAHPKLPTDVLMFSVPYNAKNFRVQLTINSHEDIQLNHTIFPQQQSLPTDLSVVSVFTEPDSVAYSSFDFIPSQTSSIISSGYLLGDNKVVTVRLFPITYNPKYKRIRIATNATIDIDYDIDSNIIPPLARYNCDVKEKEMADIEQYIANGFYLALNSYIYSLPNPCAVQTQHPLPTYTYCIITNRALEPAFKKILAMKHQKGLSAGVVCIEDLMSSSVCNGGDVVGGAYPTITDSAGVVREYLKYAFQSSTNPTQYVLLGGKAPFAPVRYTNSQLPSDKYSDNKRHVSGDIYFSDLSMPWVHYSSPFDGFQNEYIVPNIDYERNPIPYYPDLFVGRLLCTTQDEIDNYSNKLHNYTFNPGNGDGSYLSEALVVSSNSLNNMAHQYLKWVNNVFDENMNLTIIGNNSSNYLTGSQFVSYLNNNKYGFVSLYGHGEPQSIELYEDAPNRYVVTALDNYIADTLGITPTITTVNEIGNGLDCLNNKYHPFVCYSISCVTMPYSSSPSYNSFTTYENKYNFGESFTLGKNYGGVAFLGNTRYGFTNESNKHEAEFVRSLLDKKIYSIGKAEDYSKMFYKVVKNTYNHVVLEHNLLGDPEFEMWINAPQEYEGLTISHYAGICVINGITSSDTIAYCDNDGNCGRIFGAEGFDYFVGLSPTASIMVYNHEHIPYMFPLMLQNCNINHSQYVYASSFSAGKVVLPNMTNGNVAIKSGATYEVEATDDVHLGEGFIVENGATFAIKTPGKVTIDGCVFQGGANVKIEAGKVEIVKSFTAELGSKVEITQFVE